MTDTEKFLADMENFITHIESDDTPTQLHPSHPADSQEPTKHETAVHPTPLNLPATPIPPSPTHPTLLFYYKHLVDITLIISLHPFIDFYQVSPYLSSFQGM